MELSNPLISEYTWANKPSVAPLGQIICVTDIGENGILCRGDGTKWVRLHPTILYNLATPVVLTGTTAETTLLTIPIPPSLINKRGRANIIVLMALTNNANAKTVRAKIGGQLVVSATSTNQSLLGFSGWMLNLNSETSQKNGSAVSLTVDTTIANDLVITGQLANSADTLTLTALSAEII